MGKSATFDVAVIGGGVMGSGTALHLARGGMRVVLIERGRLCRQASGANAGGMTMQDKPPVMMPYFLRARDLWETAAEWLGGDAGYQKTGGFMLAFREAEVALLEDRLEERRAAGMPIEMVGPERGRAFEPGLSDNVIRATYCPLDGYGNSTLAGVLYHAALKKAGVDIREETEVSGIEPDGGLYEVRCASGIALARRLVLATGVWLRPMARWLGLEFPILCDVKQMVVSERLPRVLNTVMRSANQRLSVKQVENGTVLFGGGWPAIGDTTRGGVEIIPASVVGNIRVARHAIPALGHARLVRAWIGLETYVADRMPVIGPLPGMDDAFIIGGMNGGYTISPYMTRLLAQRILGSEPERPLFDPARLLAG
ncbi:MAG: FAD-binding oxidoreductase [Rhodospirillales bacterium]|nr:FAD-binding oxidoreductase [Rhodospirillales bacterium]